MGNPYIRPGWFLRRVINPFNSRSGIWPTLIVTTRTTGRSQQIPIGLFDYNDRQYLVAARGETQWARNLRAARQCTVRSRGTIRRYTAEEIPLDERPVVIAAFRNRWDRWVRRYFEQLTDPTTHPVFLLRPIEDAEHAPH